MTEQFQPEFGKDRRWQKVEKFMEFVQKIFEPQVMATFEPAEGTWNPQVMGNMGDSANNQVQAMLDAPLGLNPAVRDKQPRP